MKSLLFSLLLIVAALSYLFNVNKKSYLISLNKSQGEVSVQCPGGVNSILGKDDFYLWLYSSVALALGFYDPDPKTEEDHFWEEYHDQVAVNFSISKHFQEEIKESINIIKGTKAYDLLAYEALSIKIKNNRDYYIDGKNNELYDLVSVKNRKLLESIKKMTKEGFSSQFLWPSVVLDRICSVSKIETEWVQMETGTYKMGSKVSELKRKPDEIRKIVSITSPYEIMKYEVSQIQWFNVMGCNRSHFRFQKYCQETHIQINQINICPNNPVENISLMEVELFAKRLESKDSQYYYRLPTEEEWEYAARSGTDTPYFFGDSILELKKHAWFSYTSASQTHPVALKLASPNGLYDIYGNVWEMTKSLSGDLVLKGGYWHGPPWFLRSAARLKESLGSRVDDMGFRLLRTLK